MADLIPSGTFVQHADVVGGGPGFAESECFMRTQEFVYWANFAKDVLSLMTVEDYGVGK